MPALEEKDVEQLLRPLIRTRTVLETAQPPPETRTRKRRRQRHAVPPPVPAQPLTREVVATRFGGLPTVEEGETWPLCDGCADDLRFVAQVDYARDGLHDRLPIAFFTFFYCWNCHPWGRDHERGGWLVRSYTELRRPKVLVHGTEPDFTEPGFDERHAVPRLAKSLPDWGGLRLHCPELWALGRDDYGFQNWVDRAALKLTQELALRPHMRNAGVALGGYPHWVHDFDVTPLCTECARPMELLLQIRPTELTDAMWGDVGTLYLFMCRTHTRRTGLRMQCT
ncbi:DUF1963 domain-containing protein [Streptomyces sp. NPDC006510]|uniref:DUF1963 domain-containing protein n=1 Tax=Streptomyces sp. NPDC006510 TaxID=3155600 RepID=UPI0033BCA2EF